MNSSSTQRTSSFPQQSQALFRSKPSPERCPGRIATILHLYGIAPAAIGSCRVLELGCGDGADLIAMAVAYPGSCFVGVDASAQQIACGKEAVKRLSLRNLELVHQPFAAFEPDGAPFDYILCHGVYSWVEPQVQLQILSLASRCLAARGAMLLSFNSWPGWGPREVVAKLLRDAVSDEGRDEAIAQARGLIDAVVGSLSDDQSAYGSILRTECEHLRSVSDPFIFQELLNPHANACALSDVARRAADFGLKYVAEARIARFLSERVDELPLPEDESGVLLPQSLSVVEREQRLDLLFPSSIRMSIWCREGMTIDYRGARERMEDLYVTSPFRSVSGKPLGDDGVMEEFQDNRGFVIESSRGWEKAMFLYLQQGWPHPVAVSELYNAIGAAPSAGQSFSNEVLAEALYSYFLKGAVELYRFPPRFATQLPSRPEVHPFARLQLAQQSWCINYRHEYVVLNEFDRRFAAAADGSRDLEALAAELDAQVGEGDLAMREEGTVVTDDARRRTLVREEMPYSVERLLQGALIRADGEA